MKKIRPYIITAGLCLFLLMLVFQVFKIDPILPLNYSGDAIVHYNFAKNIEDTGWWAINPRFGAPMTQTLYDFPLTENLQLAVIKLLVMIGMNWYQSVNIYYILTFPLVALASLFVMKKMGINTIFALSLSIIYSFLPYHFLRGVNHLFLSGYFIVPIAIYVSYCIASRSPLKPIQLVIATLLIASCGAYYTFFSLFFVVLGGFFAIWKKLDREMLGRVVVAIILTLFFFFLNYLPVTIYTFRNGINMTAIDRRPSDTETFGLKIVQLLLPFEDHNISLFNKIQKRYISYGSTTINENQDAALGITATFGFLILLIWVAFRKGQFKLSKRFTNIMDILALFNLGAVLFATVGGFSSILSTYVNPTFRSVNRMSVFIAFISLITVGLILQYIRSRKFQLGVAILLVSLALFDQVSIGTLRNFSKNFSNFESLSSYAVLIETAAGPDAKIFTLPVGQYPEGSDKDMLRVALLTKNISWSTGAEKWRASNYWQHKTSQLETKQFLAEIIKQGFTGILVDTKKIDKNKLASIENELSTSALEDTEKQYRFYDVQNYARTNNISYNPTKLFYYISGNCVYNGLSSFYCVKAGQVQIENMFDKEVSKTLYITIERPNGNREGISRSLSIPVGTSNYVFGKSATENVFPVPYDIPSWPLNMGYPNFIVRSVEIH